MTAIKDPPLKWHGGKGAHRFRLARWIISLMPPHLHYVEPFAGGLSVLLAKSPDGISEVVNDLNGDLTNFWRVLQQPKTFARFRRLAAAIPFSEVEWRDAGDALACGNADQVRRAVALFVRCRQSLAGRMNALTPLSRTRTRGGMNEQASAWLAAIDGLPAVHARLRGVVVLNRPALDVIAQQDGLQTLFYLDPPYLHVTRSAQAVYRHEMTESDHRDLLSAIKKCRGKIIISGYPSRLYDETLANWSRHTFDRPNNAAGGATKRRMSETVWCNFTTRATQEGGAIGKVG